MVVTFYSLRFTYQYQNLWEDYFLMELPPGYLTENHVSAKMLKAGSMRSRQKFCLECWTHNRIAKSRFCLSVKT